MPFIGRGGSSPPSDTTFLLRSAISRSGAPAPARLRGQRANDLASSSCNGRREGPRAQRAEWPQWSARWQKAQGGRARIVRRPSGCRQGARWQWPVMRSDRFAGRCDVSWLALVMRQPHSVDRHAGQPDASVDFSRQVDSLPTGVGSNRKWCCSYEESCHFVFIFKYVSRFLIGSNTAEHGAVAASE